MLCHFKHLSLSTVEEIDIIYQIIIITEARLVLFSSMHHLYWVNH
jgi:hypothetical protein